MNPSLLMPSEQSQKLVLLGVGQAALHVAKINSSYKLFGTTRNKQKLYILANALIEPICICSDLFDQSKDQLSELLTNANVLVSFPPDPFSDKFFSKLCQNSKTVIYISSTSVYGSISGVIDENSPVDRKSESSKLRLEAEDTWLNIGAIILRTPGLYGASSGLHLRLKNDSYRLPIKADNYISRIHLEDLARIILTLFTKPLPSGSIRLVGDLCPAPQKEVVEWLCQKMNISLPPQAAPDTVHSSLTSNRRIQANKILNELNIELRFPSYKEGYKHCLELSKS